MPVPPGYLEMLRRRQLGNQNPTSNPGGGPGMAGIDDNWSTLPSDDAGIPGVDPSAQRPSWTGFNPQGRQQTRRFGLSTSGGTGGMGFGGMGLTGPMGPSGGGGGGDGDDSSGDDSSGGNSFARNPLQNIGTRRLHNSAVNWSAYAGIQNALDWSPNPGLQAAQFRAQGMLPSYNGVPLDLAGDPNIMRTVESGRNVNNLRERGLDRVSMPFDEGGYLRNVAQQRDRAALSQPGGFGFGGGGFPGMGTGAGGFLGAGGTPAFRPGGMGASAGPLGLPLEQPIQNAIGGILRNPSPYSGEQQARLRSQATSGLNSGREMAVQQFRADAVRRGLNPAEIEGGVQQINARFDQQGQASVRDFETQQALLARQGLLGGIGAGQGLMNSQIGREADILRYLAQMGAAQAGQTPLYLSL